MISNETVIGYAEWHEREAKDLRLYRTESPSMPELAEMHEETAVALRVLLAERDTARFAPLGDNHHNALRCPHCNPDRIDPAAERAARQRAETERDAHQQAHKACQRVLDGVYADRDRMREALREIKRVGADDAMCAALVRIAATALGEPGHE